VRALAVCGTLVLGPPILAPSAAAWTSYDKPWDAMPGSFPVPGCRSAASAAGV
jgi:hypothetical protein